MCGIHSREGLFSSYHLLLLFIHFMQYQNHADMEPVLPLMLDFEPLLDPKTPLDKVIRILNDIHVAVVKCNRLFLECKLQVAE